MHRLQAPEGPQNTVKKGKTFWKYSQNNLTFCILKKISISVSFVLYYSIISHIVLGMEQLKKYIIVLKLQERNTRS